MILARQTILAAFPQTSYTRWTTYQYTDCCLAASMRVYHTIPSSGAGSSGTNYDQTTYGYDVMKRRNRTVTPGGTITFQVYDTRGQVISTYIGTNDAGATEQDPTGGGLDPDNNMVLVTANIYDDGADAGDGNLTQQTQHVDATTTRVTSYEYDWRNRRTTTDGELDFYQIDTYDNLNRIIQSDRYDTDENGHLIARSQTKYDNRGRVYQTIRYGVNPSTGTVGNALTDNTWYDPSGHTLCALPSGSFLFTKTAYDSLGRPTTQSTGYNPEAEGSDPLGSSTPDTIADDVLLEQSTTTYDDASNAIQITQRQRYHNAPDTQLGALGDPATTPKARVTYAAMYPDALARQQATANYGTNGGTTLSRPTTIPTPSDTILVNSETYDSAGNLDTTTDPAGMVTKMDYDDAGRETAKIANYLPEAEGSHPLGSSSSSDSSSSSNPDCPASDDTNVTVLTSYTPDGQIATLTAVNATTGNQVTTYVYGTTLADSAIATSTLKRKEIYPDSVDSSDVISFTYNRQQQVTTVTDQGGKIHAYDYDALGRQTQDRVTALGTGVDGTVRRIASTYDVRGMRATITSWDNPTVGSGNVLNQCQFEYNDFGQLVTEYQSHDGAVNLSTTPQVGYTYADGSDNTIRPTGLVYPNGRVITYDYGDTDDINDRVSRISAILDDDDSTLAGFAYLGRGTFVEQDNPEPQIQWTLIDLDDENDPDTGDIYAGLDRFGRVKDNRWYNYNAEEDVDRIQYGYDRAGNRIWRRNVVAASMSKEFDELYTYDAVHRLKDMERGLLNNERTALTACGFAQCWSLDSTGNWKDFRQANTDCDVWDLEQTRTANEVNEITGITNTVGSAWAHPAYSPAGNMTTIPQPADPSESYTATYDAWNRLVKMEDGEDTVSTYAHDGAKRRIVQIIGDGLTPSDHRHFYYNDPASWQVLEERFGTSPDSSDADRQFVWGIRYIDDGLLRDRNTGADGTFDERLYACQDANWNVTAIIDTTGDVQDRYGYQPYGQPLFLDPAFIPQSTSSINWETLYAGYRWDQVTQLYFVRNRVLHPMIGIWVQRDLIEMSDAPNLYMYVIMRPLSLVDPLGLQYAYPGGGSSSEQEEFWEEFGTGVIRIKNCAAVAVNAVKKMPGAWGGKGDAIRHCTWICCVAQGMGEEKAIKTGEIHEKHGPATPPEKHRNCVLPGFKDLDDWKDFDQKMDEKNNKIGAELGEKSSKRTKRGTRITASCSDLCEKAYDQGKLVKHKEEGYRWEEDCRC